jgi:hypothetical protein
MRYGTDLLFYSGHRGAFRFLPASAAATVSLSRQVAIVVDGLVATGYSGLLDVLAVASLSGTPVVTLQQDYALVDDGTGLPPFNAVRGAFGPALPGAFDLLAGGQIAVATPAGMTDPLAADSAHSNSWVPAPSIANPAKLMTGCAAMLVDAPAGIAHALGARGQGWVALATAGAIEAAWSGGGAFSGTLCVRSGSTVHAFDPRTQRWRSKATSGVVSGFLGQAAALVVNDGVQAYGFSNTRDSWAAVQLSGPVQSQLIQTHAAILFDGSFVRGFAGVGQVSTIGEYPDFWRSMSLGSRFRVDVAGEPGAVALLAFSPFAAEIPSPPFGTLLLDPTTVFILAQAGLPGSGVFGLTVQVPDAPVLSGLELHFQAGILGPAGVYLSNSAVATFL